MLLRLDLLSGRPAVVLALLEPECDLICGTPRLDNLVTVMEEA
jgi:hypothetical protein